MDSMKNTALSLAVLFLLLGCVAVGKYLFMPDTASDAQSTRQNIQAPDQPQIERYQISCTTSTSDSGVAVCVIIDTVNGKVVNVLQPKTEQLCGSKDINAGTIDCNNTLVKPQGESNAEAGSNTSKTLDSTHKGGGAGTGGGRGDGSGGGNGGGSGRGGLNKN